MQWIVKSSVDLPPRETIVLTCFLGLLRRLDKVHKSKIDVTHEEVAGAECLH
jgi:hypothetical protein